MQGFPEHIWRKAHPTVSGKGLEASCTAENPPVCWRRTDYKLRWLHWEESALGKTFTLETLAFPHLQNGIVPSSHAIHYQLRDLGKASTLPLISFLKNGDNKPGSGGARL